MPERAKTTESPDFFTTYGFVVLRNLLDGDEVARLRAEVLEALSANYELPTEQVVEASGTKGYYLPMTGPRTPVSRALLGDARIVDAARAFLGRDVVPKPAKGILYRDASSWHADSYVRELDAVKVVAYLDPLDAGTGALRVLPGSHHADVSDSLREHRANNPPGSPVLDEELESALWPGLALETDPGDVIVFDVNLWHASLSGRDRLQWSASYAAVPRDERETAAVRHYVLSFLDAGHEYDTERYPYFDPDWSLPGAPPYAEALNRICAPA
ncbi:phytanoyl-CoA dioxygenase family protein [Umezawaea tangerina]|uniref:Ectoine hydroxylase-related dioxygenase (Phytanoyl-CoA dioxygenase family) n=1 Tax=Umezawaea tangerina TaxID=84725 RepID=A0A2T0SU72_9PSEU|nr:phytanoyl-CoA dioxygenase family protein [Umezawaea tangerina]PRY36950.1 ectoine hydroxylase-related dioxygenase (phytanoyl-CoA dioxygenase family) [Umezawaea tangerina]